MKEIRKIEAPERLSEIYKKLTETLIRRNVTISTMESCSSGLVASLITDTEGSSAIFKGAIVSYSNDVKCSFGVPEEIIKKYGVYSPTTASAMAKCAAEHFESDISVGITGSLSNTDKNNKDSVKGSVYFSVYCGGRSFEFHVGGIDCPTRNECKRVLAATIGEELLRMLGE